MAQGSQFPLRKPPGFHYDFFLLGVVTFLAGLLGVPAPNGLIPQAPIHTTSLVIMGSPSEKRTDVEKPHDQAEPNVLMENREEVAVAVVEQRVSNLAQGSLCLVLLTGPFLHVLSLIPRGMSRSPYHLLRTFAKAVLTRRPRWFVVSLPSSLFSHT